MEKINGGVSTVTTELSTLGQVEWDISPHLISSD